MLALLLSDLNCLGSSLVPLVLVVRTLIRLRLLLSCRGALRIQSLWDRSVSSDCLIFIEQGLSMVVYEYLSLKNVHSIKTVRLHLSVWAI